MVFKRFPGILRYFEVFSGILRDFKKKFYDFYKILRGLTVFLRNLKRFLGILKNFKRF